MCAEYTINTSKRQIEEQLERRIINQSAQTSWSQRVKLSTTAPVIFSNGEELILTESVFPVRPFPNARLSGHDIKSADVDANVDVKRIYERPTWRKGFTEERLIAPMTSFYEPAYWGKEKGNVVEFKPKGAEIFFVAAIRIKSQTPPGKTGHALLTHIATMQMLKFHHRLLVILEPGAALEWLSSGVADPEEKFEFLLKNRVTDELKTSVERTMAKGWEKRVEDHEFALEAEKAYAQAFAAERKR